MSGLFLIVSNFDDEIVRHLLTATKGGYPHVTLFYSGKKLESKDLIELGSKSMYLGAMRKLTLDRANVVVNSFFEEKTNKMRHDVLLNLDEDGRNFIEHLRTTLQIETRGVTTRQPHITHSIHYNEHEAQRVANVVRLKMPIDVHITGFTID